MTTPIPPFSDLPLDKDGPLLNAWGLYGPKDQLGTLNRLTDATVAAAATSEIRTGRRVNLDWPLDAQADLPFFGRQAFEQTLHPKRPAAVFDDVWHFNTQSSSQWDGLRHFGYQREQLFYNRTPMAALTDTENRALGVGAWAKAGGIVGRGVLLDVHGWRIKQGLPGLDGFGDQEAITLEMLKRVAVEQGVELRFGDVLFVRSGYMVAHREKSREELVELRQRNPTRFVGVEQTKEMCEWLWSHFSAAAGDQPAWESWPAKTDWRLHEVMLGGWGMPIGEYFDLEELAAHCQEVGRWSFFLCSQPNNVPAGVASPPNAVAIF